jgi:hypothetical protein
MPDMTASTTPSSAPASIDSGERLKLWVTAGGRCAMCNKYLLEHEYTTMPIALGEAAHNVGRSTSERSPRGNDALPVEQRNLAENLLLLCPEDHDAIDKALGQDEFPVGRLREIKRRHADRIRRLTELTDNDKSVIIRMIGEVRDTPPTVDGQTVRITVATDGKYPRYELGAHSESGVEIDLRRFPGEGEGFYWTAVERAITDVAVTQLGDAIRRGLVRHLSVFGFARIPALILLGHHLDDKTAARLYQFHQGTWAWPEDVDPVDFDFHYVAGPADGKQVTVLCSISGPIDQARVPREAIPGTIYELRPDGADPNRDLFRSAATLANFGTTWRRFLSHVERAHPGIERVDVLPAVPLTAAIEMGRSRTREVHPTLVVWDRAGDTYVKTVEVRP